MADGPSFMNALRDPRFRQDVGRGLTNALYRGMVAGAIGGPVDLAAMAMRPFGYNVEQPVGGSEWIGEKLRQMGYVTDERNSVAEGLANALTPAAIAGVGKVGAGVENALSAGARNLASPSNMAMRGQRGAVALAERPATDEAMRAVGFERGFYRGGPKIVDGRKSGDWYTRDQAEAADYARRFGDSAEVREYALPSKGILKFDASYDPRLANDLAARVEPMGEQGAKLAKELRSYQNGERPSGMEVWRGLSKFLGEDSAMELLGNLGFRGVQGVNSPNYVRVFPQTMVRDAERAKFAPARLSENDIFGAADPRLLGAMAGAGGLGLAAYRNRGDE